MLRLLYMLALAGAMTDQQASVARTVMKARGVPPWSIIVNAALSDQIAFTQQDKHITYIDAARLKHTPNTYRNILIHESGHLCGAQHFDGSLGMSYSVTLFANGSVVEDSVLLLPSGL